MPNRTWSHCRTMSSGSAPVACAHGRAPLIPHLEAASGRDDVTVPAIALRASRHDEVRAAHAPHLDAMAGLARGLPVEQAAERIRAAHARHALALEQERPVAIGRAVDRGVRSVDRVLVHAVDLL